MSIAQQDADLRDYLSLVLTLGVGPITLAALLERFGSASAVLAASPTDLSAVPGVGVALSRRIRSSESRELAVQTIELCERESIRILRPHAAEFPRLLRELPDPPSVLYVRGS